MELGTTTRVKQLFILVNGLIFLAGIIILTWGLVSGAHTQKQRIGPTNFASFDIQFNRELIVWNSGGLLNGLMAQIGFALALFALLGIVAAYSQNYPSLTLYAVLTGISLADRVILWVVYWIHGFEVDPTHYGLVAVELFVLILTYVLYFCFTHTARRASETRAAMGSY